MWGLITLGEQTQVRQRGRVVIEGDHSIFLMIEGIIILLITLILIGIYIFNIRDAYRTGRQIEQGIAAKSIKQSLTDLWEKALPIS